MSDQPLTKAATSQPLQVARIAEGPSRQRLMEMGVLPGQTLTVAHRLPFGGPLTVRLDGGLLVLRRSEAELVLVAEEPYS